MSDPGGAFFHDLIEGVVIWEDSDDKPSDAITVPAEAQELHPVPAEQDHSVDTHMIDVAPSDHLLADAPVIEAHHADDAGAGVTDHVAGTDHSHEGDGAA